MKLAEHLTLSTKKFQTFVYFFSHYIIKYIPNPQIFSLIKKEEGFLSIL